MKLTTPHVAIKLSFFADGVLKKDRVFALAVILGLM